MEIKPILTLLREGRQIIAEPSQWTQGSGARDSKGNVVNSTSPQAVCWCSIGALHKAITDDGYTDPYSNYYKALKLLRKAMDFPVGRFNDTSTHEEVLAAWDKAIELAKEKENENQ